MWLFIGLAYIAEDWVYKEGVWITLYYKLQGACLLYSLDTTHITKISISI